jgi:sugar phosphate isomerase/epimerase
MYGVSPAWVLSLYGEGFTCSQTAKSLSSLADLGYRGWQPQIFLPEALKEWESGAGRELMNRSLDLGMTATQFGAHFLLHAFKSEEALISELGIGESARLMTVLDEWPELAVVTIPIPAFSGGRAISPAGYRALYRRLVEKLSIMTASIEAGGRRCGLEINPGALIGGSEGFLRLKCEPGLENLGVNLDTGHFHAAAEPLALTLGRIGDSITGTHLCDNDGITNESLEPGAGSVEWEIFLAWAQSGEYDGSWDIEILCPADEAEDRYSRGLAFLRRLLANES